MKKKVNWEDILIAVLVVGIAAFIILSWFVASTYKR